MLLTLTALSIFPSSANKRNNRNVWTLFWGKLGNGPAPD